MNLECASWKAPICRLFFMWHQLIAQGASSIYTSNRLFPKSPLDLSSKIALTALNTT